MDYEPHARLLIEVVRSLDGDTIRLKQQLEQNIAALTDRDEQLRAELAEVQAKLARAREVVRRRDRERLKAKGKR